MTRNILPTTHQAQLAVGEVWHARHRPAQHSFRHGTYFLMLPMRQLRQDPGALRRSKWGTITFWDADHGDGGPDALAWFDQLLQREGIDDADGEVWLQTYPRVFGHAFKPVSFWYAHRQDGSLAAVVAEVNNTFGERHCYLLSGPELDWGRSLKASKVFHVSPFCSVDGEYRFTFTRTADRVVARVDLHDDHGPLIQTSMSGQLAALTPSRIRHALWRQPFMTMGVVALIHWHALRLFIKRVPFFSKPAAPERFVTR
ncbi:MAG: DUF1365 domain-containing protein [Aquabacterium sp.]